MRNALSLAALVGSQGVLLTAEGLRVRVTINDVRLAYGNTRYVVSPVAGTGTATVDSHRVTLLEGRSSLETDERAWARGDRS